MSELLLWGEDINRLWHHRRSFVGCYSLYPVSMIRWEKYKEWKKEPSPRITKYIGEKILRFAKNHYDLVTACPPSASRKEKDYCCYKLGRYIAGRLGLKFVICFKRNEGKKYHSRHASLKVEKQELVDGFKIKGKSILLIDDFINSGMTIKRCYEALRKRYNHVDALIFGRWNG